MALSATLNTMSGTPQPQIRVFALNGFSRFARRMRVSDEALWKVVFSPPDADLGGGLYKFRVARPREGARGGGRALVALKVGHPRSCCLDGKRKIWKISDPRISKFTAFLQSVTWN